MENPELQIKPTLVTWKGLLGSSLSILKGARSKGIEHLNFDLLAALCGVSGPFGLKRKFFCPQCEKKEQDISNEIIYDFTRGKNSHLGGTALFVCTNCGSPMKPKEKAEI